ncbi:REP-associated tyrosine transposase [Roseovarius aestuariivivens]|uniref:REP-associated tyrosine transposase n=1 Tax=Roseovarius aestuariivivens TaxID=1888910 RepID=UPI001AEBECE1|nr:transposase [Roseovarius aestuariivivens]
MAQYIRPRRPGATIFFTLCLQEAESTLLIDEITRLRQAVRTVREVQPFRIDSWVVLPDHLHAIWTLPDGDCDYAARWAAIKARFSRGLPGGVETPRLVARREKGIWQRRFWEHHIRDAADLAQHRTYCWTDPVRHGLVRQPRDWRYSSYHRDALGQEPVVDLPRVPTGERAPRVGRASARP